MSQAVAHMDEMTQQNAALAEESAASAGSLSDQIERLNDLVATFKVSVAGGSGTPNVQRAFREQAQNTFAKPRPPFKASAASSSLRNPPRAPAPGTSFRIALRLSQTDWPVGIRTRLASSQAAFFSSDKRGLAPLVLRRERQSSSVSAAR